MAQANPLGPTSTDVSSEYDPNVIRQIIAFVRQLDQKVYTKLRDVVIAGAPDSAGRRPHLILRSPDGNYWQVSVDNAGVLSTTSIPQPTARAVESGI